MTFPNTGAGDLLPDTGDPTGRGNPYLRGSITGLGTFLGGIVHTLPFLIPQYREALIAAVIVIAFELLTLAWLRYRFFHTCFLHSSFASVALGGAIIAGRSERGGVARVTALCVRTRRCRRWGRTRTRSRHARRRRLSVVLRRHN